MTIPTIPGKRNDQGTIGTVLFVPIGMYTEDCKAVVKDLESRGFEVDMSTAKYRPDGTLNAVYLKREVGGFALHIVRKP